LKKLQLLKKMGGGGKGPANPATLHTNDREPDYAILHHEKESGSPPALAHSRNLLTMQHEYERERRRSLRERGGEEWK